jgi:hypothetical protein
MKTAAADAARTAASFSDDAILALMKYLKGSKQPQNNQNAEPNPPLLGPALPSMPGAPKFGAAFELAYVPAFIKAANARGIYFKDLADLGRALMKTATLRIMPGAPKVPPTAATGYMGGVPIARYKGVEKLRGILKMLKKPKLGYDRDLLQKVASMKTAARIINADVGLLDIVEHMRAAKEAKAKAEKLKTTAVAPMGSSGGGAV